MTFEKETEMKNFVFGLFKNAKQGLLTVLGKMRVSWQPFWISFAPAGYKVKGREIRRAMNILQPGDVVCRRYTCYVDGWFIPGRFSHSGIYVGNDTIIHALGDGVQKIDPIDFFQCDGFAILRPKEKIANGAGTNRAAIVQRACEIAKSYLGYGYDYNFDICEDYKNQDEVQNRTKTVYCHELTRSCYPDLDIPTVLPSLWNGMIRSKKRQFLAQSFFDSPDFDLIYDSEFSEVR